MIAWVLFCFTFEFIIFILERFASIPMFYANGRGGGSVQNTKQKQLELPPLVIYIWFIIVYEYFFTGT